MRVEVQDTCCVVIDYQEKIVPTMYQKEVLLQNSVTLLKGLAALSVPMLLTTQYAKGLGCNVPEIREAMGNPKELDKTTFSVYETSAIAEAIQGTGKKNVLICGIEAHICVLQSAIDLKAAGYQPVIVADCVSYRTEE
ncbi:MAG: isochorismatase family protein, partial [Lachnospiraceae bacterium]|nr:isochorismatase family protein [Lachnospiraceae bacterium]